ncbi:hypothetical protein MKEN_01468800 [Mycena kentingensis (nom. inval.)]|nr:hypothetical protein MKEN_01468800 [Mycena kentingensis (nom. inval.)]
MQSEEIAEEKDLQVIKSQKPRWDVEHTVPASVTPTIHLLAPAPVVAVAAPVCAAVSAGSGSFVKKNVTSGWAVWLAASAVVPTTRPALALPALRTPTCPLTSSPDTNTRAASTVSATPTAPHGAMPSTIITRRRRSNLLASYHHHPARPHAPSDSASPPAQLASVYTPAGCVLAPSYAHPAGSQTQHRRPMPPRYPDYPASPRSSGSTSNVAVLAPDCRAKLTPPANLSPDRHARNMSYLLPEFIFEMLRAKLSSTNEECRIR